MDGTNLTQVLARKSATLEYDDLPREARELARQCILDYFGVAVAGPATSWRGSCSMS